MGAREAKLCRPAGGSCRVRQASSVDPSSARPARLASLDVFRGLVILLMLLVNNIALDVQTPAQLLHADWGQGVHVADLVFPWFLLIVGVSLSFSGASWFARGGTVRGWRLKGLQRAFNLFAIGCLVDCSIYKQLNVYMDVLQLIGLAWWFASFFYDLSPRKRVLLAGAMLVWYQAVLWYIPWPGYPTGHVTPDDNAVVYLDALMFARIRLHGLICVVPTAALVLLGTLLGDELRGLRRTRRMVAAGVAWTVAGMLFNVWIPYSKPLWTSAYILFTGGLGALALAGVYRMVDVGGLRLPPLTHLGMNAFAVYVAPIIVKLHTIGEWTWPGTHVLAQDAIMNAFYHHFGRYPGGWLYTWAYIAVVWLFAWGLYRKGIFWRV